MKSHTTTSFLRWQFWILAVFIGLTVVNETLDLPHLLFNDPPNEGGLRRGEILLESLLATLAVGLEIYIVQTLRRRICLLEGIIPICAWCKSIRDESGRWQRLEAYVGNRSPVQFTHGYCPDCFAEAMAEIDREDGVPLAATSNAEAPKPHVG